jgi:hypothetical protein
MILSNLTLRGNFVSGKGIGLIPINFVKMGNLKLIYLIPNI